MEHESKQRSDGKPFGYRSWHILETAITKVTLWLFKLLKIESNDRQSETFVQFVGFCVVGVLNTLVGWAVYYAFVIFDPALYLIGNATGYICGVMNSYYWNSRFVFRKAQKRSVGTLIKTYISYGITLLISTGLMYLLVHFLSVSEYIAPIPCLLITVPINFALSKLWAFKPGSRKNTE
jgi:putative flippase GtrA